MNNFPDLEELCESESYIKFLKAQVATEGRQRRQAACIRCSLCHLSKPIPRRKRLFEMLEATYGTTLAKSMLRQFGIPVPRKY